MTSKTPCAQVTLPRYAVPVHCLPPQAESRTMWPVAWLSPPTAVHCFALEYSVCDFLHTLWNRSIRVPEARRLAPVAPLPEIARARPHAQTGATLMVEGKPICPPPPSKGLELDVILLVARVHTRLARAHGLPWAALNTIPDPSSQRTSPASARLSSFPDPAIGHNDDIQDPTN
jgi:hypothetical protein